MFNNKSFSIGFRLMVLILILVLVGCTQESDNQTAGKAKEDTPLKGGELNVAIGSEPDSLDWMYISATATRDIAWNMFENLFALDQDFRAKPMIAKDYELSDDEKTYTIHLREDVKFHNGSTVTAEDVVASIERWRKVSSVGSIASKYIEQTKVIDEHTLEIKLKEVYSAFVTDMTAPKSALIIIPADIAKEAGDRPLKQDQLIGTGPYQFTKWDRGNEIVLSRFDDYIARDEADWDGLTGKKVAYIDKINFQIVKDPQVMVNGLKTGLYDYVQNIPADLFDTIDANSELDPVTYMNGYHIISMDKSEAPFDDIKVRQVLQSALDKKSIAQAAYGNEQFYHLDGALFDPDQGELYSEKGTDSYLAYDKQKAEELLNESNYDGKTLTILYSNDTVEYEKIAQITKQQLEEVGFSVKLEPYEWATYLEKWMDAENWDLVVIGWSTRFSPNELGMLELDAPRSGWYISEKWEKLIEQWGTAKTIEQKQNILGEMNQTVYDELPFAKVSNVKRFDAKSNKVSDLENWIGPRFWNLRKQDN